MERKLERGMERKTGERDRKKAERVMKKQTEKVMERKPKCVCVCVKEREIMEKATKNEVMITRLKFTFWSTLDVTPHSSPKKEILCWESNKGSKFLENYHMWVTPGEGKKMEWLKHQNKSNWKDGFKRIYIQ